MSSSTPHHTAPAVTLVQKPLVCSGHSRGVPQLNYSSIDAEGNFYLISACLDGKAMLRIGKTGDWLGTFVGHKGAVWSAALNHDSTKAVTGSADYTAKIWDATTGGELRSVTHKHIVKSVAFAPDSTRILAACQDGVLAISDVAKSDAAPTIVAHQAGCCSRRAYWFDANSIVTGSTDGVTIWDVRSNKPAHRALAGLDVRDLSLGVRAPSTSASAASPLMSGDDSFVCVTDKAVHVLSARDLSVVKSHTLTFELSTAALDCTRGRIIVAGGNEFASKVLDFADGTLRETHKGHHGALHCVRVAPDGATFASASEDATVRLWQSEIQNYGLWVLPGTLAAATTASTTSPSSSSSSSSSTASPATTPTASTNAIATTPTAASNNTVAPVAASSPAAASSPTVPLAKGSPAATAVPAAV